MTFVTIEVVSICVSAASVLIITRRSWDDAAVNSVVARASFDNILIICPSCSSSKDVVTFATGDFIAA